MLERDWGVSANVWSCPSFNELTRDALARGEELDSLEVRRPTLEDVYLDLVDDEAPA